MFMTGDKTSLSRTELVIILQNKFYHTAVNNKYLEIICEFKLSIH